MFFSCYDWETVKKTQLDEKEDNLNENFSDSDDSKEDNIQNTDVKECKHKTKLARK